MSSLQAAHGTRQLTGFGSDSSSWGLKRGNNLSLAIRDTKGDAKAAEEAAKNFEQEKVNLIYTTQTSVTIAAKRATADIPIVFCAGADPVVLGLVESFAKPGGRLTGVFYRDTDLTAKRLEILKEIVPKLRRVVTFYDPRSPVASRVRQVGAGGCGTDGNPVRRAACRFRRGTSGGCASA